MIPVEADLVIVDWSGLVHGIWHRVEGRIDQVKRAVAGDLLELLREPNEREDGYPAPRVVLALDAGLGTHRDELTKHLDARQRYKANREQKPRDFWPTYDSFQTLIDALQIPTLAPADFAPQTWEADDAAASACKLARAAGLSVLLVTRDKDWRQLVTDEAPAVRWWSKMDELLLEEAGVIEKHGVPPHLLGEWLALVGDSGDNVPGVEGLGPKKVVELIKGFASVDVMLETEPLGAAQLNTMAHELEQLRRARAKVARSFGDTKQLDLDITGKARELALWKSHGVVHVQREAAELSRKLVALRDDCPIELDLDAAIVGGWNVREVERALQQLGAGWLTRQVEPRPKRLRGKARRRHGSHQDDDDARPSGDRGSDPHVAEEQATHERRRPDDVRGAERGDRRGGADRGGRGREDRAQAGGGLSDGRQEDLAAGGGTDRGRGAELDLVGGERRDGGRHDRGDRGAGAMGGEALREGRDDRDPGGRGGRDPVLTCSYSACATDPLHVRARELVAAIATTADAPRAIAEIRRLGMTEGWAEEHAQLAIARWRELEENAA
jgi:5'-3' exonuclease